MCCQRAAPQTTLLSTAIDNGLKADTGSPTNIACSDALGAIDFMARNAHQVDVGLVDVHWDFAHSLSRIRMEVDATVLAEERANFLYGLNDARFVIHGHYRDYGRVRTNCCFKILETNDAVLLHWQICDIKSLLLELPARVENAFVLLRYSVQR